jgi:tetratricopeptide (TPR) repeat protein
MSRIEDGFSHLRAVVDFDLADNMELKAKTLNVAGVFEWRMGAFANAREYFLKSLEIWQTLENPRQVAAVLNNLGMLAGVEGHEKIAEEHFLSSIEIAGSETDVASLARFITNLGALKLDCGRYEDARQKFEEAARATKDLDDDLGMANLLVNISFAASAAHDEDASDCLRKALKFLSEHDAPASIPRLLLALAYQLGATGQIEEASYYEAASSQLQKKHLSPRGRAEVDLSSRLHSLTNGENSHRGRYPSPRDLCMQGIALLDTLRHPK